MVKGFTSSETKMKSFLLNDGAEVLGLNPKYGFPHIPGYLIYDRVTGNWLTYDEVGEDGDYLQSMTGQGLAFAAIETWNQGSLQNKAKMLDLKRQMQAVADFLKKPRLYVLVELTEGKYREIV